MGFAGDTRYGSKQTKRVFTLNRTQTIGEVIPEKEINLTTHRLAEMIMYELGYTPRRRHITRTSLKVVIKILWGIIVSEMMNGNNVRTPIGSFRVIAQRRYAQIQYGLLGVKKNVRPTIDKRVTVKFRPSKMVIRSLSSLIEVYDERQFKRRLEILSNRSVVRSSRPRERPSYERMGRDTDK